MNLPLDAKRRVQVGRARFVKEECVVKQKHKACGACAEHCPTKAVQMVPFEGALRIPELKEELCIGCGACEHPCPTRPRKVGRGALAPRDGEEAGTACAHQPPR
jgi:MinD superfamily P-loop ATPase